jgi:hypothetical protein
VRVVSTHRTPLGWVLDDVRDPWSIYVRNAMAEDSPVTVGIGVLSDVMHTEGPCIILAVDDKASYGVPPITTNNACGKFHDLLPILPVGLSISGDIGTCDAVVAEFYERMKDFQEAQNQKNEPLAPDHLRIAIREARHYEYRHFLGEEMRGYLGMTLDEWQKETNPEKKRKGMVIARAARLYFPVWIIAGGFWGDRYFGLMKSSGACVTEMGGGHYACGLGDIPALKILHRRNQEAGMSAPRSLLHVAEAMEAARKSAPKYIGKPADYIVLRRNKPMMRFNANSPVLAEWLADFKNTKDSTPMQDDQRFRNQFVNALYKHIPLNPV